MYLEPWHCDIMDFLDLKKNHDKEELRARDLFYAMWIPDLFMKRVAANGKWTLMCPDESCDILDEIDPKTGKPKVRTLQDAYGDEFEEMYERFVTDQ